MNRLSPLAKVVIALVVIWVAMGLVGILIRGLFFLFVIALVLFGFTLAGGTRGRGRNFLNRR
ncbi:hypothetical protein [Jatrophihabitans endophyticus]|uniref:hypothetical protein n=1 Tax=Jatrophihabitans endophyticus TaxID=1206085 RepID=UPI0019F21A76|nr:hypothetical protein [Jatrophihabitans endophyticus]MBE7188165.1 hypothetical protein [Jatrophihabitans endophyticus]